MRRRKKPKDITSAALSAYGRRRLVLRKMGFTGPEPYEEYLASGLWAEIKLEKLREGNKTCFGCGAQGGMQVHHGSYERPVMLGKANHHLYLVCRTCHETIEYFCGQKLGPREATERLKQLRKANGLEG